MKGEHGRSSPASRGSLWELRPAGIEDLDAIAAMETESFPDPWSRAGLSSMLRTPIDRTWIALASEAAGSGLADGFVSVRFQPPEAEILRLAVRRSTRRRGLGSLLLLRALEACREVGANAVYLEVRSENAPALALYSKHGFRRQTIRRNYYPDGSDALVLSRITGPDRRSAW